MERLSSESILTLAATRCHQSTRWITTSDRGNLLISSWFALPRWHHLDRKVSTTITAAGNTFLNSIFFRKATGIPQFNFYFGSENHFLHSEKITEPHGRRWKWRWPPRKPAKSLRLKRRFRGFGLNGCDSSTGRTRKMLESYDFRTGKQERCHSSIRRNITLYLTHKCILQ